MNNDSKYSGLYIMLKLIMCVSVRSCVYVCVRERDGEGGSHVGDLLANLHFGQ